MKIVPELPTHHLLRNSHRHNFIILHASEVGHCDGERPLAPPSPLAMTIKLAEKLPETSQDGQLCVSSVNISRDLREEQNVR